MLARGWRCGGPGSGTGDTSSVYTSAGGWIEGVSSAGGVKSISSSKWSSNSYKNNDKRLFEYHFKFTFTDNPSKVTKEAQHIDNIVTAMSLHMIKTAKNSLNCNNPSVL